MIGFSKKALVLSTAAVVLATPVAAETCAEWFQGSGDRWEEPQDTQMALLEPDCYAWRLFIALNWPAIVADKAPNTAATFGANAPVVWETWRNASNIAPDTAFPPDGSDPGPWLGTPLIALGPERFDFADAGSVQLAALIKMLEAAGGGIAGFDPNSAASFRNETRLNKATYEFVRNEELYNVEGQVAKFTSGAPTISFPPHAKEVKAQWREIAEADKPRYHWVEASSPTGPKIYGLSALHITTKDLPNWLWATFEHIDNREAALATGGNPPAIGWLLPSVDRFACPAAPHNCENIPANIGLEGTQWENYRLRGTQIDFFDSLGRPTMLANSQPEGPFQMSSSCITCHALSSIDGGGKRLFFFSPAGEGPLGLPSGWVNEVPTGYFDAAGNRQFTQLDFVWSLSRARPRQ